MAEPTLFATVPLWVGLLGTQIALVPAPSKELARVLAAAEFKVNAEHGFLRIRAAEPKHIEAFAESKRLPAWARDAVQAEPEADPNQEEFVL